MKQLFIPDIGTEIVLAEDWNFILHAEYRNETLATAFGYAFQHSGFTDIEKAKEIQLRIDNANNKIIWPTEETLPSKRFEDYRSRKSREDEFLQSQESYQEWSKLLQERSSLPSINGINVVIPKGSKLKIDRIYIRKGASDYSSITFYLKDFANVETVSSYSWGKSKKVKSPRFWAKLEDCNRIKFETC